MAQMIRADAKPLAAALARVMPAVQARAKVPVLTMVRLRVVDGALKISGTDLDMQIDVMRHPVEASGEFETVVDPRQLGALLRSLGSEVVRLSATDDARLAVTWSDGEASFGARPAADFPDMKPGPEQGFASLPPTFVSDSLDRVALCISRDECRYYLNGACIDADESGRAVLVATDGHRLAVQPVEALGPVAASRAIIHSDTIKAWASLGRAKAAALVLHGKSHVTIRLDDVTITAKLIDGTFPAWPRVVPASVVGPVTVTRAALESAAARMASLGDERGAVSFEPSGGGLKLSAHRLGTSVCQSVAATGQLGTAFGANLKYLREALDIARGQSITLAAPNAVDPILVRGNDDPDGAVTVIMPVRIAAAVAPSRKRAA